MVCMNGFLYCFAQQTIEMVNQIGSFLKVYVSISHTMQ